MYFQSPLKVMGGAYPEYRFSYYFKKSLKVPQKTFIITSFSWEISLEISCEDSHEISSLVSKGIQHVLCCKC